MAGSVGRPCIICSSAQRTRIERQLVSGEPISLISKQLGCDPASVRRHLANHAAPAIRDALQGETIDTASLIGRIQNIADALQSTRRSATAAGATSVTIAASAAELKALTVLVDRLGIDSDQSVELILEARILMQAVASFLRSNPASGERLLTELENRGSANLAEQFRELTSTNAVPQSIEKSTS